MMAIIQRRRNRQHRCPGLPAYVGYGFLVRIALFCALAALVLPCPAQELNTLDSGTGSDYSHIADFMRRSIPSLMKGQDIPGLAIVLVDDERILWAEGFGFADPEEKIPATAETLFSIQSISKTVTATAVMMAVQDGLVRLDAPITEYLPDFTINSRFETRPQEKMTLRHLLSHKAGLTHNAPPVRIDESSSAWLRAQAERISETWLRFPVGQRYSYSNLGVSLAGYILEVASGSPFEDYVEERVLEPLGMRDSSFDVRTIWASANRAVGYGYDVDQGPPKNMVSPPGGGYSNALEMGRFIQFHLNRGKLDGQQILAPALLKDMYTIPFPVKDQLEGYALGVSRSRTWGYRFLQSYYLEHSGAGDGFRCAMQLLPEYDLGAAVLSRAGASDLSYSLLVGVLTQALRAKGEIPSSTSPYGNLTDRASGTEDLRRLRGNYIGRNTTLQITCNDDQCGMTVGRGKPLPLHLVGDNEVFVNVTSGLRRLYRVTFGDDGLPRYLVLVNDGDVFDYNDGPNDKPGPNKKEWDEYLGTYAWIWDGQPRGRFDVHRKNGYLYLGDTKLTEFTPGFFFTADGEVVSFRDDPPTWRNLELRRVPQTTPAG